MTRWRETTKVEADLLWNYIEVNDNPHKCQVEAALGFDGRKVAQLGRYLREETAHDVILPSGMSPEPHVSFLDSGQNCQCGVLQLNYSVGIASDWQHRRLVTLKGHAESCFDIGGKLVEQFPDSVIHQRLVEDARRVLTDVQMALSELE